LAFPDSIPEKWPREYHDKIRPPMNAGIYSAYVMESGRLSRFERIIEDEEETGWTSIENP
jgi:hypothetical protein